MTASGVIDAGLRVFRSGEVPALVVTAPAGARQLRRSGMPPSVRVAAGERADRLSAGSSREAVGRARPSDLILVEGGPHLIGDFFAEQSWTGGRGPAGKAVGAIATAREFAE